VDENKEKLVQSPLSLTFGKTRPQCDMKPDSPCQIALGKFRVIAAHIGTRDLVQEFLASRVFPTLKEWDMPRKRRRKSLFGFLIIINSRSISKNLARSGWTQSKLCATRSLAIILKRRSVNDCGLRHSSEAKIELGDGCFKF
jgi:hypothetical protein